MYKAHNAVIWCLHYENPMVRETIFLYHTSENYLYLKTFAGFTLPSSRLPQLAWAKKTTERREPSQTNNGPQRKRLPERKQANLLKSQGHPCARKYIFVHGVCTYKTWCLQAKLFHFLTMSASKRGTPAYDHTVRIQHSHSRSSGAHRGLWLHMIFVRIV